MEITIDTNLITTLERLASERSMTTEVYINNYIKSHLISQYRKDVADKISIRKLEDIPLLEAAVATVIEDIRVRDYVESSDIIPGTEKIVLP